MTTAVDECPSGSGPLCCGPSLTYANVNCSRTGWEYADPLLWLLLTLLGLRLLRLLRLLLSRYLLNSEYFDSLQR